MVSVVVSGVVNCGVCSFETCSTEDESTLVVCCSGKDEIVDLPSGVRVFVLLISVATFDVDISCVEGPGVESNLSVVLAFSGLGLLCPLVNSAFPVV